MNIGIIAITNNKGQIVIPRELRRQLGIQAGSALNLTITGDSLQVQVIKEILTTAETETSYLSLLQKTKGAWGDESSEPTELARRTASVKLEQQAVQQRKAAW